MFSTIGAAIGAFTTGRDNKSLRLRAGKNLMDIGIIQSFGCRRPPLSRIVANEHTSDLDCGIKTARSFVVRGEKTGARAKFGTRRKAAAGGAEPYTFQFLPTAAIARAIKRGGYGARGDRFPPGPHGRRLLPPPPSGLALP